jgi:preprotein translocase SecE subunit
MATAVKNNPDTTTTSLFDRPAAISLVGVVYVVGCLGIVFKLLPYFFWDVLKLDPNSNAANVVVAGLLLIAATALVALGLVLLGPRAAHGTRAGIFVGVVGVLLILLLTRWASLWFEYWAFYDRLYSPTVGAILTGVVGLGLLIAGGYYFLQPKFEVYLQKFEDQGWFSATTYKSQQGLRVRRGTILGILLIVGAGIYTMVNHATLRRLPPNWALNIPFTAKTEVELSNYDPDDFRVKKLLEAFKPTEDRPGHEVVIADRYAFRDFNAELGQYVKVEEVGSASDLKPFSVIPKSKFNAAVEEARKDERDEPKAVPLETLRGTDVFATAQLLPNIMYTLPILLLALSLWGAWRIVNYPAFADFLIATEAELNKVSWTTRRKLVQDTIVVLVTVFLMAMYLFAMDQAWSHLLSWSPIRIIQIRDSSESTKPVENKPW